LFELFSFLYLVSFDTSIKSQLKEFVKPFFDKKVFKNFFMLLSFLFLGSYLGKIYKINFRIFIYFIDYVMIILDKGLIKKIPFYI